MNKNSEKNIVLTYSALVAAKNEIFSPIKVMLHFLGAFPFLPLFMALYSALVKVIPEDKYTDALFYAGIALILLLVIYIIIWINDLLTVYIIENDGTLYKLKCSTYWYKARDKMLLINPMGMKSGKIMTLFYMVNNVKLLFEKIEDDFDFYEFVNKGKIKKISNIKNVSVRKKNIKLKAEVEYNNSKKEKNIIIKRVLDKDSAFVSYLKEYEKNGKEVIKKFDFNDKKYAGEETRMFLEKNKKTIPFYLKKMSGFFVIWTYIMAWVSALSLTGGLNKYGLLKANGERPYFSENFIKGSESIVIVYFSVIFIYFLIKIIDIIILLFSKDELKDNIENK
ncbi:hypothetical protein SAMN02910289_00975 [Lachnospiraceae bacterium RM5]|nr:hypothetical protein SAMN02910289_00975 [Lachnospiraceae bacterium RM5]